MRKTLLLECSQRGAAIISLKLYHHRLQLLLSISGIWGKIYLKRNPKISRMPLKSLRVSQSSVGVLWQQQLATVNPDMVGKYDHAMSMTHLQKIHGSEVTEI
jgi:hypothetical protein